MIRRYCFPRIFVIVWYIGIRHASKYFEVIWTMRFDIWIQIDLFITIYILIFEELDTKRLFRGFATLVSWLCHACFVTSCHACFVVFPRLKCFRGLELRWTRFRNLELRLFRDFVSRLIRGFATLGYLPSCDCVSTLVS